MWSAAALRRLSRDTIASAGGAAVFSCSLGIASVALPLLALRSGYSAVEVGVLTALSAIAQMATRLVLGAAMRLVGDWVLVVAAGVALCLSNGLVVASAAVVPFTLAEVLQGFARACFWTGSQTHVVRNDAPAVGALATINFVSSVGLLADPSSPGCWWSIRRERRSGSARRSPRLPCCRRWRSTGYRPSVRHRRVLLGGSGVARAWTSAAGPA